MGAITKKKESVPAFAEDGKVFYNGYYGRSSDGGYMVDVWYNGSEIDADKTYCDWYNKKHRLGKYANIQEVQSESRSSFSFGDFLSNRSDDSSDYAGSSDEYDYDGGEDLNWLERKMLRVQAKVQRKAAEAVTTAAAYGIHYAVKGVKKLVEEITSEGDDKQKNSESGSKFGDIGKMFKDKFKI